uniref:Uncharacterized protein n=1 Tax=Oryza rufipogon TaxID=4529 RepID=A0A0E0RH06_ORYRU
MAAPIRHTCPASFVVHASTRSAISDLQPRQIGATADPKLVVEHSPSPHLPRADPSLAPSLIHRHQVEKRDIMALQGRYTHRRRCQSGCPSEAGALE